MDPELMLSSNPRFFEGECTIPEEAERAVLVQFITTAELSVRATNVLLQNCSSLEELFSFNNEILQNFPNSGRKTVSEILGFLDSVRSERGIEYSLTIHEQLALPPEESSITLLPLFSSEKLKGMTVGMLHPNFHAFTKLLDLSLSVRTTNVLRALGMVTIGEVMLTPGFAFLAQRNCGKKSLDEIKATVCSLCLGEILPISSNIGFLDSIRSERDIEPYLTVHERLALPPEESSISLIPLFSSGKLKGMTIDVLHPNFHVFTKLSDLPLSVRTTEALRALGMETVGEVMLTPGAALLEQRNFGRKSLNELKEIVRSLCLTDGVMFVSSNDGTASDTIPIDYTSYESMVSNFIEQIEEKKRNQDLFKKRLCFEKGKVPTLEELGQTFGVTRERVRQILKKIGQKLKRKANLEKLAHFWERLDCCVAQGGGVISLRALPSLLQSEFKWPTAPYSLALGQLLLCRQPEVTLKDEDDLLYAESECLSCNIPLQQLQDLDFDDNQSFHVQVIAAKLSKHCQTVCSWKHPVTIFHRAFIEQLVAKCDGGLILRGDVVLSRDKWLGKYCDNLEDVVCHILEKHGKPMHFRGIAGGVRHENENFVEISDHNVHAAIMRYNRIELVDRGTYGLKLWGLGGYRSVTTAIEGFIEEKGLPQKRQNIIHHLKGEFSETNITTSLTKETRFTSIGNGLFYDLPSNWQHRTCPVLIQLLAEPVAEFARYLVGRNNTSYKLVMALVFIRSMDENGTIPLYKLKEMFYRFYLFRFKKGLHVEIDTAVVSRIGDMSAGEVKNKACKEPLKSFSMSGFFMQFSQNGGKLHLTDILVVEFGKSLVRDVVLIILLKATEDYFQKIGPAFNTDIQVVEKHHDFPNSPSSIGEESGEPYLESGDTAPTISIKKKGRGKIRL